MPSNFVLKLTMTNNIFYTCAMLSISTYEIIHFWYFDLNWRLQVKNLARQGLSPSSARQGLSYPTDFKRERSNLLKGGHFPHENKKIGHKRGFKETTFYDQIQIDDQTFPQA